MMRSFGRKESDKRDWDMRDIELWHDLSIKCTESSFHAPKVSKKPQRSSQSFRFKQSYRRQVSVFAKCKEKQLCYKFQVDMCNNKSCEYKHACFKCEGTHPG